MHLCLLLENMHGLYGIFDSKIKTKDKSLRQVIVRDPRNVIPELSNKDCCIPLLWRCSSFHLL